MNSCEFEHVKSGDRRVIDFFGHSMDFRRTDEECCIMIDTVPPGQGVPMHRHAGWGEFFYVLEGSFRFGLGDSVVKASPGDSLTAAAGTPHGFECAGEESGRLLCVSTPGGFEKFCEAVLEEMGEGFDPAKFARIAARFDTEFLGPLPA